MVLNLQAEVLHRGIPLSLSDVLMASQTLLYDMSVTPSAAKH